jgi:hypothetical protein
VHHFPQLAAALHIEPKIRTVAEHACENESRRRCYVATVIAQLVDVLALHADGVGQSALRLSGFMNSLTSISATVAGLRFVISMESTIIESVTA